MNAAIDIGNTFAKIGIFDGNRLLRHETGLTISALQTLLVENKPDRIILSSVSISQEEFQEQMQLIVPVLYLTNKTPVPVKVNYETPDTLGMDRLAAAVGAQAIRPNEDLIVIDSGTCITYDLLDRHGVFQGGIISPGIRMRFKAMHSFTGRLPLVEMALNPAMIGKSTSQCMQSGVAFGVRFEARGVIENYRRTCPSASVVMSGGDAAFFESAVNLPIFVAPELVLLGLNRILLHNVGFFQ